MQGRSGVHRERRASLGAALARFATYGVPPLAIATAALLFLGPGAPRGVVGLRLRGDLVEGSSVLAVRVEGVRRAWSVDDALQLDDVVIEASSAGKPLAGWAGSLDEEGLAEARLVAEEPLVAPVHVRASRHGDVLAEGDIAPGPASTRADSGTLARLTRAAWTLEIRAPRGQLVAPFTEAIEVRVLGQGDAPRATRLRIEARGAAVSPPESSLDSAGLARFALKSTMMLVGLTVTAFDAEAREVSFDVDLPVAVGAMNVIERALALEVQSPAPRERAFLSLVGPLGRWSGEIVDLHEEKGLYVGGVAAHAWDAAPRPLYAVVSADPYEQGSGVVAWPVDPPRGHLAPPTLRLLLDGLPSVEAREAARARRARTIGVIVLGLAALAEALLLLLRSRASARALDAHLSQVALQLDGDDRERLTQGVGDHPALHALALTLLVAFGFAVVAGLAMLR